MCYRAQILFAIIQCVAIPQFAFNSTVHNLLNSFQFSLLKIVLQKVRIYVSCVCTYEIFFGKSYNVYNLIYIIYCRLYVMCPPFEASLVAQW